MSHDKVEEVKHSHNTEDAGHTGDVKSNAAKFMARSIDKTAKIKLLVQENPRKKGSKTYDTFALYKDGMTVAEFLAAGGRLIDVKADIERKNIELVAA